MMGPTHATLGAALWLGVGQPLVTLAGGQLTPTQSLVAAGLCAGAALWPDMAKPGSTIARSFGPLTEGLAQLLNGLCMAVYAATRTRYDNPTPRDAHRTLTHTAVWALASGLAVLPLVALGKWGVLGLLFFLTGLALRGLAGDWAKKEGWVGTTITAAALTWVAAQHMPQDNYWWLALVVFVGTVSHSGYGDLVTKEGTPFAWPLRIHGKRWYDIAPPAFLRITTKGWVERAVCIPLFTAISLLGIWAAFTSWGQVWATLSSWVGA